MKFYGDIVLFNLCCIIRHSFVVGPCFRMCPLLFCAAWKGRGHLRVIASRRKNRRLCATLFRRMVIKNLIESERALASIAAVNGRTEKVHFESFPCRPQMPNRIFFWRFFLLFCFDFLACASVGKNSIHFVHSCEILRKNDLVRGMCVYYVCACGPFACTLNNPLRSCHDLVRRIFVCACMFFFLSTTRTCVCVRCECDISLFCDGCGSAEKNGPILQCG